MIPIKNIDELLKLTSSIKYDMDTPDDKYIIKTPEKLLKSKVGICYDIVELERYYFEKLKYEVKTYFAYQNDLINLMTHTFLMFKENKNYYWFESSWESYRGIHGPFNNYKHGLLYIKKQFQKSLSWKIVIFKEYYKFHYSTLNIFQFGNYIINKKIN